MSKGKERRKRQQENKDFFHYLKGTVVILSIAFFIVACILAYRFGREIFTNDSLTGEKDAVTYTIRIEQGESVLRIGKDLEEHGIIRSGLVFFVQSKLYRCMIAPGEYTLRSDTSSKAILKYLHSEYLKTKDQTRK